MRPMTDSLDVCIEFMEAVQECVGLLQKEYVKQVEQLGAAAKYRVGETGSNSWGQTQIVVVLIPVPQSEKILGGGVVGDSRRCIGHWRNSIWRGFARLT